MKGETGEGRNVLDSAKVGAVMQVCKTCQRELGPGDRYCPQCGTPVNRDRSTASGDKTNETSVWQQPDSRARLDQRVLSSLFTIYVSIASIIQGSTFVLLITHIETSYRQWNTVVPWMLSASTFLIIVVLWHLYIVTTATFVWVVTVIDALLHFSLGAAEIVLVFQIGTDPLPWFAAAAVLSFIGAFATSYTRIRARAWRYRSLNHHALAYMGPWNLLIVVFVTMSGLGFAGMSVIESTNTSPTTGDGLTLATLLSSITLGAMITNLFIAQWYWRSVSRKVEKDVQGMHP